MSWAVGATLVAVVAGGCFEDGRDASGSREAASTAEPAASAEATPAPDESADLARRIAFSPCAEDPELECGQLSVPVDYEHPRGEQVSLAVVRAPALTGRKRGVVFVNPGGPGGSGVDFVILAKPVFAALRASFDVVSFDPRGTARSHVLDCTLEVPPGPASDTPEAVAAFLDEAGRRYASACAAQHGALATRVGTNNAARDIDVLRAALGESTINYLGYSYGTVLGSSYATLFPQRVRAMVLDGNVTPAWFRDYLLELDADGSAGAELALRRIDQLCRATADCPLRTAGVVAVYDRLVERLDRNPVIVGDSAITGTSVLALVFPALYNEAIGWPQLVKGLALADAGDYSALTPFPIDSGPTTTVPSAFAITCDDAATRRLGLDYLPAQTGNNEIYPRFGGANFGIAITLCSQWPRTPVIPLNNLETRNKIVLIGNDFDPATPMAWTRNMATALGEKAALIRYQGGGHTIYGSGSACVDAAVEAYFRDLKVPPAGLTCPARTLSFASGLRAAAAPTIADILPRVVPKAPVLPHRR